MRSILLVTAGLAALGCGRSQPQSGPAAGKSDSIELPVGAPLSATGTCMETRWIDGQDQVPVDHDGVLTFVLADATTIVPSTLTVDGDPSSWSDPCLLAGTIGDCGEPLVPLELVGGAGSASHHDGDPATTEVDSELDVTYGRAQVHFSYRFGVYQGTTPSQERLLTCDLYSSGR
jgi:hypothetical protein